MNQHANQCSSTPCKDCGAEGYSTSYTPNCAEKKIIDAEGVCFTCAYWRVAICKKHDTVSRGHIAVIGYAIEDEEPVTLYRRDWQAPDAEASTLRRFFERMQEAYRPNGGTTRPVLIGHLINGFDLIFIFQRAVVLGIHPASAAP